MLCLCAISLTMLHERKGQRSITDHTVQLFRFFFFFGEASKEVSARDALTAANT